MTPVISSDGKADCKLTEMTSYPFPNCIDGEKIIKDQKNNAPKIGEAETKMTLPSMCETGDTKGIVSVSVKREKEK